VVGRRRSEIGLFEQIFEADVSYCSPLFAPATVKCSFVERNPA
jgi:hypothetical protein